MQHMQQNRFVVVCDNIRSTHNVGSIFRTADGAGVDAMYLCGITPKPPRPDIDKVSLGAELFVPFTYRTSTERTLTGLKKKGFEIIAIEARVRGAVSYEKLQPRFPVALVLGGEVTGLSKSILSIANVIVSIPMRGQKESLNVSVAFGIVAYEIARHRAP